MEEEDKKEIEVEKPKKKKGKFLKKFLIFLTVLAVIIVALGFIFPGLLWAKSLGITYTKADYSSIMGKLKFTKDLTPTGDNSDDYTYKYGALENVNVTFTSSEITSFFNENRPSYYPLKNVQVRVNNDGTIEAVASANVDYFLTNVLSGKYSKSEVEKNVPFLGVLPSSVNLYMKFDGSVTNNKSDLSISAVSVQGISIPKNMVSSNEAINTVEEGLDNIMSQYNTKSNAVFNKIAVENGKITFQGSVPSTLERIKK